MPETTIQTKTRTSQRKVSQQNAVQHYRSQLDQRIRRSAQFRSGRVMNVMPSIASHQSWWEVTWSYLGGRSQLKPCSELPFLPINSHLLQTCSDDLRVTWLGHSSLFIELDGVRVMTDPVFDYASPWLAKAWFKRNMRNGDTREQLPLPDIILISHDHYDHLEQTSIEYYATQPVTFYVPLGVGGHLIRWGVTPEKIIEFDWWESFQFRGIAFICTPANHNSGRYYLDRNATLWCSWLIKSSETNLFFSGDTAYDEHFAQIAARYGPIDLACLEVAADVKGQKGYPVENWGHMQASQTVQAFHDLKARKLMPIHWATYELFTHRWDEPMEDLLKHCEAEEIELLTPMVGETLTIAQVTTTDRWWQGLKTLQEDMSLHWELGFACSLLLLLMVV